MALDFIAGCIGGAAGVIVGHPLDTVKVRLQTQSPSCPVYKGTYDCLTKIIKQESVRGLYKGISSPLVGVAGVNAIIFGVYGALRPYVSGHPGNDTLSAHFVAGSISGAVQSVVASPMELVKTRMQVSQNTSNSQPGPLSILKRLYKHEGGVFRGVFKGWGITVAREIPGFGFYFASYEALTRLGCGEVGTLGMMLAGGLAGVISWIVTFPIDVVKTRLQCDDKGKYKNAIDCIRKTYNAEGHKAFSRGLFSTVIRAFPTNAATFTVVTWIMRLSNETTESSVQTCDEYLRNLATESIVKKDEESLRETCIRNISILSCSLTTLSQVPYGYKFQPYLNFASSHRSFWDDTQTTKLLDQIDTHAIIRTNEPTEHKRVLEYQSVSCEPTPSNVDAPEELSHETASLPATETTRNSNTPQPRLKTSMAKASRLWTNIRNPAIQFCKCFQDHCVCYT